MKKIEILKEQTISSLQDSFKDTFEKDSNKIVDSVSSVTHSDEDGYIMVVLYHYAVTVTSPR